jgi:hypothetical protein
MMVTITRYHLELKCNYEDLRDAFGILDQSTIRAFSEFNVIDELLNKLK